MKYGWQTEGMFGSLDPQVAGEHFDALIEKYNEHLTPDEILADARSSRSPLHKGFEWDDAIAAEKHRKRTAKTMVQNLVPLKNGKKQRTRAFVFVHHDKHGRKVFINVRSAMGRPDMRDQVIAASLKQLERWIGAYGGQVEMRFVAKSVDRLRRRIQAELMAMV